MLVSLLYLLYYVLIYSIAAAAIILLLICGIFLCGNDFPHKRNYCTSNVKLEGKATIVTGSNTGIGYETAKDFALRGARVIMACRNVEKAEAAKSKIIAETGNDNIVVMQCDLSDLESVQNFCKNFVAKESALHILVNNAGVAETGRLTLQQFDFTFGTNYVGHFLLTYYLLELLRKSAPSRIVNVTSEGNFLCNEMKLMKERNGVKLPGLKGYAASKLANILHARELARQLQGTKVTTYSCHPGFIYSGLPQNQLQSGVKNVAWGHWMNVIAKYTSRFASITAEQGAQTSIFCAVDESVHSGKYYDNCKVKEPNKLALDVDLARRLWNVTLDAVKDYVKPGSE